MTKKTVVALALAIVLIIGCSVQGFASVSDSPANLENIENLLNSVPLAPTAPQSADLNEYLDWLVPQITQGKTSAYEKLLACYNYIVLNTKYGSHMAGLYAQVGGATCRGIYSNHGETEGFGAVALITHVGMCNAYAAAFILMARKVGLQDIYLEEGYFVNRSGRYNYHKWAEAKINGQLYVFDPQVEQNMSALYNNFCRLYSELPGRYVKI
ncbi:MAG: hypothetical protein LBC56_06770 [Oscillospiraceae bacterium]|jgi:transglutaminase/protease-like cytokinesis protein 3|nr:hypothetical protein [Oscillospiraceae bacterium]